MAPKTPAVTVILYGTSVTKEPPMRAAIGIASTLALCPRRNGIAEAHSFRQLLVRSAFCAMGAMLIGLAATSAQGQCTPQELAKLIASDAAANDLFGISVAVSGDTAIVGAHDDDLPDRNPLQTFSRRSLGALAPSDL